MRAGLYKRVRVVVTGVSVAALALALQLPPMALAFEPGNNFTIPTGGLTIERNCNNLAEFSDAEQAAQCNFNLAHAEGHQDIEQDAEAKNKLRIDQQLDQYQENQGIQVPLAANVNVQDIQGGEAKLKVESGDAVAYGHYMYIDNSLPLQQADSSTGDAVAVAISGDANTDVHGDSYADGGDASAEQDSEARIEGGDAAALVVGVLGGRGSQSGSATGGDSGDVDVDVDTGDGGNADSNYDAGRVDQDDVAFVEIDNVEGTIDDSDTEAGHGGGVWLGAESGAGGHATSGDATGAGGDADVDATASSVGDNASADADGVAVGGSADGGVAGHQVLGGITGDANASVSLTGGVSTNVLNLTAVQSGDVYALSGDAVNTGSAVSNVEAPVQQWADARARQDLSNQAEGSNTATADQNAEVEQAGPDQNVWTGGQDANGSARVEALPFPFNNFVR